MPSPPQESRDGAAAIEWAAQQPWSNGRLGMLGDSFPGITQVGVAALRPPHLDAIAPFQVTTDLYRDVGYPGGITNTGFGAFWAGVDQPNNSYRSGLQQAVATGDSALRRRPRRTHLAADADAQHRPRGACSTRSSTTTGTGTQARRERGEDQHPHVRLRDLAGRRDLQPRLVLPGEARPGAHVGGRQQRLPRAVRARLPADHRPAGRVLRPLRQGRVERLRAHAAHPALARRDHEQRQGERAELGHQLQVVHGDAGQAAAALLPAGRRACADPAEGRRRSRTATPIPARSLGNEDGIVFGQNNLLWKGRSRRARPSPTRRRRWRATRSSSARARRTSG